MRFLEIMHDEWYQAAATETSGDAQGNVGNPGTNSSLYLKSLSQTEIRRLTMWADVFDRLVSIKVGRRNWDVSFSHGLIVPSSYL